MAPPAWTRAGPGGRVPLLLNAPVALFTGKGGVGKTTLAAACALRAADAGARTLLVSTDPAHSTADLLGVQLGTEPVGVEPRLHAVELDPDREAARYVAAVREHVAAITPPGLVNEVDRQLALARETPGVVEAAVLVRLAGLVDDLQTRWDRVVVDTAPFGHTLRLLAMPAALTTWLDAVLGRRRTLGAIERMWRSARGSAPDTDHVLDILERRRAAMHRLRTYLCDPTRCAVALVAVPERLSLLETRRSEETLRTAGMHPAVLFLNRVRPERTDGLGAFAEAFPSIRITRVDEMPDEVRDRSALRYIGARLEGST